MNGDPQLDSLLDLTTTTATPAENTTEGGEAPMTMQEITELQQQVLLAKQGKGERPSRELLKRAYDSLRYYRSGAGAPRKEGTAKSSAKVAPMSDAALTELFGANETP